MSINPWFTCCRLPVKISVAAQMSVLSKLWSNIVKAKDVIAHLVSEVGRAQVRAGQALSEFSVILWLNFLPSLHADALGLHGVEALYMNVNLSSEMHYGGRYQPAVEFGTADKKAGVSLDGLLSSQSTVLHQINTICEAFFTDHWPCQDKQNTLTFLVRLYRHIEARVSQLGNLCEVCGRLQEHAGLKPVPCWTKACNDAFDEHGIATDLRDIYNRPVIADLLISMASAACQCTSRRDSLFKCLPSDLLLVSQSDGSDISASKQIDWERMEDAFQEMPSVARMAKEPSLQEFFLGKSGGAEAGMTKFRLLRSVLNSCRGHLMQLQGADMFPMLETEHQFRLCTDNPSKEANFARRKKILGSHFLFHGSPFYNWHSILRGGLKNLSGSNMMSNGASYGPGIYFSEMSIIAAPLCARQASPAWSKSIFGTGPRCIALCEVINDSFNDKTDPGRTNDGEVRVVPDDVNVITRYLFVYSGSAIPNLQASALQTICEGHTQTQEDILQKVKSLRKAFRRT